MDEGNYIKINRKILEWEWYSNINTCRLFIHMLLKANWKDGKFEGKMIRRGSFVSSIGNLATETKLTNDEVRTALKHLISTKEITKQSFNKFTVFTVVNYELYQTVPKQVTNQVPSSSQSIPKLFPTIEEGKKERREERNKKENIKEKYFDSEKLNSVFFDFIQMRKKIKAPMTDKAIDLAVSKLKKLSEIPFSDGEINEDVAIEILNNSIMNNWKGLFPLKENKNRDSGNDAGSFEEMWRNA